MVRKVMTPSPKPIANKDSVEQTKNVYQYDFSTYVSDDTGYYVTSSAHVNITVNASSKTEALKKVWQAFEGEEYEYKHSRKAKLQSVKELSNE